MGPMLSKHGSAVGINLAEGDRSHSCPLKAKAESADAGEEVEYIHLSQRHPSRRDESAAQDDPQRHCQASYLYLRLQNPLLGSAADVGGYVGGGHSATPERMPLESMTMLGAKPPLQTRSHCS